MDDVFGDLPPEGQMNRQGEPERQPAQAAAAGQDQQQPQAPQGDEQQQPDQPQPQAGEGEQQPGAAPPAAKPSGRTVPVEALEATRNDWRGKFTAAETRAAAAEAEARVLREQLARSGQQPQQPQQPQEPVDPVQAQFQRVENMVLNTSEKLARQVHTNEVVDKAWERVQQEFRKNPALHQQIIAAPDPWGEVVEQGKRLLALDEIGSDPAAYRAKIEAEIRASLAAGAPPAAPAAPRLPESLAGVRSAGARGATYTGPTPFESMFPN